jgi:hypothetical protein
MAMWKGNDRPFTRFTLAFRGNQLPNWKDSSILVLTKRWRTKSRFFAKWKSTSTCTVPGHATKRFANWNGHCTGDNRVTPLTKRCRLSLLTNSALLIRVQTRGRGEVAGSQPMSTAVHHVTWSPNNLCISTSIFNLCWRVSSGESMIPFSCGPQTTGISVIAIRKYW